MANLIAIAGPACGGPGHCPPGGGCFGGEAFVFSIAKELCICLHFAHLSTVCSGFAVDALAELQWVSLLGTSTAGWPLVRWQLAGGAPLPLILDQLG